MIDIAPGLESLMYRTGCRQEPGVIKIKPGLHLGLEVLRQVRYMSNVNVLLELQTLGR